MDFYTFRSWFLASDSNIENCAGIGISSARIYDMYVTCVFVYYVHRARVCVFSCTDAGNEYFISLSNGTVTIESMRCRKRHTINIRGRNGEENEAETTTKCLH